jgi:hypothetical protein
MSARICSFCGAALSGAATPEAACPACGADWRRDGGPPPLPAAAPSGAPPPLPGRTPGRADAEDDRGIAHPPHRRPRAGRLRALSLALGLGSTLAGAAAVALNWTDLVPWSPRLALLALVAANAGLLLDWFGDVERYSVSVVGVTTATVALCLFLGRGGVLRPGDLLPFAAQAPVPARPAAGAANPAAAAAPRRAAD